MADAPFIFEQYDEPIEADEDGGEIVGEDSYFEIYSSIFFCEIVEENNGYKVQNLSPWEVDYDFIKPMTQFHGFFKRLYDHMNIEVK